VQAPDFALDHYNARVQLATAASAHLESLWARVDPDDILLSWAEQMAEATAVLTAAQLGAANMAEGFLADSAVDAGVSELPEADVIPRAFAGVASDGRGLVSLLTQPAFGALGAIGSGHDVRSSLATGRASLSMISQTQVADAGRGADQAGLAAYRQLRGYVRVVQGDACSRCIILAGRVYGWSSGFKRHPNCHCTMLPVSLLQAAGIKQTPERLYSLLTAGERRVAGWSLADQAAIDAGADIYQVTNARQGMYTAGGKRYTTAGTTRRGLFGGFDIDPETGELTKRPRGAPRKTRLTVDQIFADARNRDEAIRLLRQNGYLTAREPVAARRELVLARPAPSAAASAVDPALKLTVAQLKQIARDANVPLFGATRKADIVRVLRDRESVYETKIKGLPEWKAPRPVLGADIAAPPLGVPAKDPVLSGSSLNEWADYFKYDRQYQRYQYVDANGNTPPEGIRVHNLRANIQGGFDSGLQEYIVSDGTAFSFDGIAYLIEHPADQFGSPWVSRTLADLRAAHEAIPAAKLANKSYAALAGSNPSDAYWRAKFNNPNHVSAAMAGHGNITMWNFRGPVSLYDRGSRVQLDLLRHETGHNIDDMVGRGAKGAESPAWAAAAKADVSTASKISDLSDEISGHGGFAKVEPGRGFPEGVTSYGRSSVREDYAESVRLYQQGVIAQGRLAAGAEKGPVYFRDLYPARAKILDDVFPDIAKAQKAQIAALRAPKPKPTPALSNIPGIREVQVENRIRQAYNELPKMPGGYLKLSELRDHPLLRELPRNEVDAALMRGSPKGMQMAAFDNRRALTARDRAAAIDLGQGDTREIITYRRAGGVTSGERAPMLAVPKPPTGTAAAGDLSKLKVTELRALAKERGVTGYTKLTKPQLLEALGKPVPPPEDALVVAARARQAQIDYARARAELLSETEEWLNNQGSLATMAVQLRRDALRYGIEGHKDMAALFRAIDAGDEAKVRKAIEAVAKKQNLTRVDRAGEVVKFDRSLHADIGKDLKPGQYAIVVRPGYTFDRNGELVRLHKAKVEKATAQEIAAGRLHALPRIEGKQPAPAAAARSANPKFGETSNSRVTYREQGQAGERWTPELGPLPSGAYEENCTNAVNAFEMRMRGYDVTAAPLDVLDKYGYAAGRTFKETDELFAKAWRLPNGKPHGRSFFGGDQPWRSFRDIDAEIEQHWPEGGRGVITVGRHIFNVVKLRGKAQYIEAQYDANASRVVTSLYRRRFKSSGMFGEIQEGKLIRLDDLVPTDGIYEAIEWA